MEEQTLVITSNTSLFLPGMDEQGEAWRLLDDMLITTAVGGPLTEQPEAHLEMIYDVLDLGCGSGGWALHVAQAYPEMRVTGVDASATALRCARMVATIQRLENACFQVMQITQPFPFPDDAFDLVNARLSSGVFLPARWPAFLGECARLLRPGGVLRLTEGTWGLATTVAPAVIRLLDLCWKALSAAGYDGAPGLCSQTIMPLLVSALRALGFQGVSCRAWLLDYSAGTSLHASFVEGCKRLFRHARPFVVQQELASQEEVDRLSHQALTEVGSEHFVALLSLSTVWGTRPHERTFGGAPCQDRGAH